MADRVFNISKGRHIELYRIVKEQDTDSNLSGYGTASLRVFLLQVAQTEDDLVDHATMSAVFGANTEAAFTSYANKKITSAALAALPSPDGTNNRITVDLPDQTWTAATSGTNLVRAIVAFDPDDSDTDATTIPMYLYDFVRTTTGADLPLQFDSAGAGRAQEPG